MQRFSAACLGLLVGSSGVIGTLGCDGASPTPPSGGGAASGGSSGTATSGASSGGVTTGGAGASGQAGSSSSGKAGAAPGGSGGSSGGSGGAGQAGGTGGGTGGGSGGTDGGCMGAAVCDDFESYTGMPGAPWTVSKNEQGTVAIDTAQHHSGTKAVKFTLSGAQTYQRAFIGLEEPFPIANNAFYGRMMIYITAAPNDGVHWTMIQGEGPVTTPAIQQANVRYGGQTMERLMANYDTTGVKSDCWKHSQTKMPEGKWACMEWYFEGASNTQKFWLDGAAIDDITVMGQGQGCLANETNGTWYFPKFERVFVGWESYQQDDPREVWIDDVAIGTSKIGCPAD